MRRALQEAERRWVIPSNRAELQSRSHDRAGGGRRGLQTRARQPAAPTARVVHRKNEVAGACRLQLLQSCRRIRVGMAGNHRGHQHIKLVRQLVLCNVHARESALQSLCAELGRG